MDSKNQAGSGRVNVILDDPNGWSLNADRDQMFQDRPPSEFWRKTITIVLVPFVLIGAPVFSSIDSRCYDSIDTTSKWFWYIFSKPKLLVVNVLALIITLVLNIWLLYLFGDIVIKLFILGEIPSDFIISSYLSVQLIPIILAVNLFWLKVYILRHVIHELDTFSMISRKQNFIAIIIKIIVVYVMCFSLHIISYVTFDWRLKSGFTAQSRKTYFTHLPLIVISTLLVAVYITFLLAIEVRFRRMNESIKRLIANLEAPDVSHLREIKTEFKANGLIIGRINKTFNVVMSVFFGVILIGIAVDFFYILITIIAYMMTKGEFVDGTLAKDSKQQKELVRCISADVLVILMKASLIGITILQTISVNHQSRSAPIHLSDFFSQFHHLIHIDLYHSFRLLHNYMRSRLEKTDRPSLVINTFLMKLPFINRLLSRKL